MPPAASTATQIERNNDRLPLTVPVEFRGPRGNVLGNTVNISRGGMFVQTGAPRNVGERLFFRIQVNDENPMHFHLEGEVVWARKRASRTSKIPRGMGIRFLASRTQNEQTISGIFSILNRLD